MINRRKDISKRKYISPMLVIEETEPWELMAGTNTELDGPIAPGDGTNDDVFGGSAKSNSFFVPYSNDFEETTEE